MAIRGLAALEGGVDCDPIFWAHRVQVQNLIVRPNLSCSSTHRSIVHLAQVTVELGCIHSSQHWVHLLFTHRLIHY